MLPLSTFISSGEGDFLDFKANLNTCEFIPGVSLTRSVRTCMLVYLKY